MADGNSNIRPLRDDGKPNQYADYLRLAKDACDSGDVLISMYLYLAAFQKSSRREEGPSEEAIFGLKQAWALACDNKERSLAEYIFELLEPYLSSSEMEVCTEQLQTLAFEKLAEIGVPREYLESISESISADFDFLDEEGFEAFLSGRAPSQPKRLASPAAPQDKREVKKEKNFCIDPLDGSMRDVLSFNPEGFNYSNLVGYSKVIDMVHEIGIGLSDDKEYARLLDMLNRRHGLTTSPAVDSILVRSEVREDANRFVFATAGEIGLPAIHMRMEQSVTGSPLLCVSTYKVDSPTSSSLASAFTNGGVLILENLDYWESPVPEPQEDGYPFFLMQMTRGAREAISLIRSAVDTPGVYVFATSSKQDSIDEFFLDLLEPLSLIDIDLPDEADRHEIWMDISKNHPSFRQLNKKELVKYSANMSRFDIYMAAREAVEDAYKAGMAYKKFIPVTRENMFEKLAGYQPIESDEYSDLENEVIRVFQDDIDHIDNFLE